MSVEHLPSTSKALLSTLKKRGAGDDKVKIQTEKTGQGWQCGYLLSDAVELGQDVEERHLGDNELLLLILIEWGGGKVQCQVHERGLYHRLLVLIIMEQLFFLFRWLEMNEKTKEKRSEQQEANPQRHDAHLHLP